jgi:hypothetical protein
LTLAVGDISLRHYVEQISIAVISHILCGVDLLLLAEELLTFKGRHSSASGELKKYFTITKKN